MEENEINSEAIANETQDTVIPSEKQYNVTIADNALKGKLCPFCKTDINEGEEVIVCPACNTPHHKNCWEENKGCTTFGCSEQHYEAQGTNPTDVCPNCGATLGDGQAFCSKCGQKRDVILQSETNSAIAEFNKQLECNDKKKKAKKKVKVLLFALIPLLIIGIGILGYFKFYLISGTYKFVSSDSKATYTFDDGKYTYVSETNDKYDENKNGRYELKLGEVTLIDEDGDKTTYNRTGNYLYNVKNKFTQVFDKKCNSDQTFSLSSSYKDISLTTDLKLNSNGKYTYVINMTYTYDYTDYEYKYYGWYLGYQKVPVTKTRTVSDDLRDDSGTYEVSGDKIILNTNGGKKQVLIVKDDYIYYTVLEKK